MMCIACYLILFNMMSASHWQMMGVTHLGRQSCLRGWCCEQRLHHCCPARSLFSSDDELLDVFGPGDTS